MLTDELPERGHTSGPPEDTTLHLQVDSTDVWFNCAVEASCTVQRPVADQFWGDRYANSPTPSASDGALPAKFSLELTD